MKEKHLRLMRVCAFVLSFLVILGTLPSPFCLPVFAESNAPLYAAAFMGAKTSEGTTLPPQVNVGGKDQGVVWNISENSFSLPYSTVKVNGTAGNMAVTANVVVVPPSENSVIDFVDCGRIPDSQNIPKAKSSYDSPYYDAVKELCGASLMNQAADQRYVSGSNSWGLDESTYKVKNSINGNNKGADGTLADPATNPSFSSVGIRAVTTGIAYKLEALPGGTYTITSGFYDWYGNRSRGIQPKIDYQDKSGNDKTITLDALNTQTVQTVSCEFTIPDDIDTSVPMTLTYANASGENPILSWFAVVKGSAKKTIDGAYQEKASEVSVTLNGNDIHADNVNGLTFKGFGVLSANSTSALLMDYKSEHPDAYRQMLQILFGGSHPIMTNVKIEMGNDRNNSTGPDPCTKRTKDEPANVTRAPGFQLAADAKAINPKIKVTILRWNSPGWVKNNDDIYTWYKETILAAYRTYGYMVDYVNPGFNEQAPDLNWTKQYADRVKTDKDGMSSEEQALYHQIKVVISDEASLGSFGPSMINDEDLRNAVSVAGYHYNTDDDSNNSFKQLADTYDKEVWNSEAQATFSNSAFRPNNNTKDPTVAGTGIGGTGSALEMANTIVKGFVNSRRTNFIYQPAIGSFYEGAQYSFKELLSARDPWSGWIHYDAGLAVLEHFSRFAKLGWENDSNTEGIWRGVPQASSTGATGINPVNGRNGIPNYITLASPDKKDFSTVIVNDSEQQKNYAIQTKNMGYVGNPSLEVWETRAADQGQAFNSNYMKFREKVSADVGGTYTVKIKPYSIVTVTTLEKENDAETKQSLPVEGNRTILDTDQNGNGTNTSDKTLYADNFDYSGKSVVKIGAGGSADGTQSYIESRGGDSGAIPRYTNDLNGAFEVYKDKTGNYVLRQQIDSDTVPPGAAWNGGDPVTVLGDYRWTNYKVSTDVSFETNDLKNGANYAAVGARQQNGTTLANMPYVLKYWFDGSWQLLVNGNSVAKGNVANGSGGVQISQFHATYNAWHNIAVQVAGNKITAYLDGTTLASYSDPKAKLSGRVALGSGFYHTDFDNLKVTTVDGYVPYYSEQLDNLEMYDLAATPHQKLIYGGSWTHENGQGMDSYQRSLSISHAPGATMQYTFTGTGLDILGKNDGSAKLEAMVDGKTVETQADTLNSGSFFQTYTLRGLKYGQHTVQIKVLCGTLVIDSMAVVSGQTQGTVDMTALSKAIQDAGAVTKQSTFQDGDWMIFENALSMAREAVGNSASYHLDQEGVDQLTQRLSDAKAQLYTADIQKLDSPTYQATYVSETPELPQTVGATHTDGKVTQVPVTWNLSGVDFNTAYSTVTVVGAYGRLKTKCYVEVVPKNIMYFADLNGTKAALGYDSPAYLAVKELLGKTGKKLLNDAPDQVYDSSSGWGHQGYNAAGQGKILAKGAVFGDYNKLSTTGFYTSNDIGASLTYTFDHLPTGDYKVVLGTNSWWPASSRTEKVILSHDKKDDTVDTITLDNNSSSVMRGYRFTMAMPGTATIKLVATNNQSPVISFVGLAPISKTDKTALQKLYDNCKNKANDNFTEDSWSVFQQALNQAKSVLSDEDLVQNQIDGTTTALQKAVSSLKTIPTPPVPPVPPVFPVTPSKPIPPVSPVVPVSPVAPKEPTLPVTFVSDTKSNIGVTAAYTFKITSKDGKAPRFIVGTPGIFDVQLVRKTGSDYYFKIIAVGAPGAQAGIYINGSSRLLVATVKSNPSYVRSDTTHSFNVRVGKSYVFKLTANTKPYFIAGTGSAFTVSFVKQTGKNYFFRVTAVGKVGQASGFYINRHQAPIAVSTIS